MDQQRRHNPYGPLQDEVIRLLQTPRLRCKGFFADIPPEERSKYVIPPPPEDNDVAEEPVWRSTQETVEGRQIRGRNPSIGDKQLLQGATEELRPQGALEASDPVHVARAREERNKHFGHIGADKGDRGSKPRRQQSKQQQPLRECAFCRRLGETRSFARTHVLRDPLTNAVVCPILREHRCEICGATGDSSHTRSYCPNKPQGTHNMALLKSTPRNSTGKRKK